AAAYASARVLRIVDGPDEVHRNQVAKIELAQAQRRGSQAAGGACAGECRLTASDRSCADRARVFPDPTERDTTAPDAPPTPARLSGRGKRARHGNQPYPPPNPTRYEPPP